MSLALNHLSTHLNTYRNIANFSSMAGEKWFKESPVFAIAQQAFIALNGCFLGKEGVTLINRCQKKSDFTWETWGPRIAHILNIVAVACSFFYLLGYINTPLFILGCSSRIIPYATQFFQESSYAPLLEKIKNLNPPASSENQPISNWFNPIQMLKKLQMGLTAPDPSYLFRLSEEIETLLAGEKKRAEIYRKFDQLIEAVKQPLLYTNDELLALLAENFLFGPNAIENDPSIASLIARLQGDVQEIVQFINTYENQPNSIQLKITEIGERVKIAIDLTQNQGEIDQIKTNLQNLLQFDQLINLGGLILGIVYVVLLTAYCGPFPYEGLIYLLFSFYGIYDFWKSRNLQSIDLQKLDEWALARTYLATLQQTALQQLII